MKFSMYRVITKQSFLVNCAALPNISSYLKVSERIYRHTNANTVRKML